MALSFVQLNIERDKHFARILPFLKERDPDVLLVQELYEKDIPVFEEFFGARGVYGPMAHFGQGGNEILGVGIFSRLPIERARTAWYAKMGEGLPVHESSTLESMDRMLLACDIVAGDTRYRMGTTHFTWTPDGEPDDLQRRDLNAFLAVLEAEGELVFTGDFNAARGKEIFSELAERYTDNVPPQYETSIDGSLHRVGPLPYMVDGVFSTPGYRVSGVEMVCGVSDHCALVGTVEKRKIA